MAIDNLGQDDSKIVESDHGYTFSIAKIAKLFTTLYII